jgi:RNA polymerase sigma factor (sigma-70 family)
MRGKASMTALEQLSDNEQQCAENLLPFEVLYERYHTRIYHYIRAHLHNDDDVADLVQQVFFQIWMRINTYQSERGSFATWVFSIAHHRLVDYYRMAHSAVSWEPLCEITLTEMNPEEILISAEALARVNALIDALSDAERELLALRFVARLSLAKIAAIIGKNVDATRKQLTRLIQRLHRQYYQLDLVEHVPASLEPTWSTFVAILLQIYTSPARLTQKCQALPQPCMSLL